MSITNYVGNRKQAGAIMRAAHSREVNGDDDRMNRNGYGDTPTIKSGSPDDYVDGKLVNETMTRG